MKHGQRSRTHETDVNGFNFPTYKSLYNGSGRSFDEREHKDRVAEYYRFLFTP